MLSIPFRTPLGSGLRRPHTGSPNSHEPKAQLSRVFGASVADGVTPARQKLLSYNPTFESTLEPEIVDSSMGKAGGAGGSGGSSGSSALFNEAQLEQLKNLLKENAEAILAENRKFQALLANLEKKVVELEKEVAEMKSKLPAMEKNLREHAEATAASAAAAAVEAAGVGAGSGAGAEAQGPAAAKTWQEERGWGPRGQHMHMPWSPYMTGQVQVSILPDTVAGETCKSNPAAFTAALKQFAAKLRPEAYVESLTASIKFLPPREGATGKQQQGKYMVIVRARTELLGDEWALLSDVEAALDENFSGSNCRADRVCTPEVRRQRQRLNALHQFLFEQKRSPGWEDGAVLWAYEGPYVRGRPTMKVPVDIDAEMARMREHQQQQSGDMQTGN